MKKLLLLLSLYTMGIFASQPSQVVPVAAQVVQAAGVAVQKTGWIASLAHKGSECITRAVNFVRKNPINLKVAYAAAGAALTYVASSMYEKFYHPSANKVHSDDFQTALTQLVHATNYYDELVHELREGLAFFIPAYTSLRATQALRNRHYTWPIALTEGLGAGAGLLPLMPLVCSYPVDGLAHIVSHVPSPCVVNRLRKGRLEKEEAWKNIRRIIQEKKYSVEDITRMIYESHMQLTPTIIDTMKSYAVVSDKVEEADIWVSGVPQKIQEVIDHAQEIKDHAKDPAMDPACFKGIELPKGVLLLGEPGTGKTLFAKFMGKEIGGYYRKYSAGEFFDKYISEGEKRLRYAYDTAQASAKKTGIPAIIFIDEAEQILQKRNFEGQQHGYEQASHSVLDQLLTLIDDSQNVITICASNMPQNKFDPAFLRRMTHIVTLGLPTDDEAFRLLTHEAEKYPQHMAPLLQNGGQGLQGLAHIVASCQLSRDGICKTVVDAVRSAVARERPVRKQSMQAYKERLRKNPEDRQLQAEIQDAANQPIFVQPTDIIQALTSIREKMGNPAVPDAMMQRGQLAPLSGRPRRLSSASPMTVAWRGRAPVAVAAAAASAAPQLPDTYEAWSGI